MTKRKTPTRRRDELQMADYLDLIISPRHPWSLARGV
jgi:hypothetical protein